ncbi:hypothetical protein CG716_00330 [Mycolicibacterium sphagni]|uniref:Uncharacterized protein n=1 Tax=Mycolicibacterium sphagni TaxID=1786 RepID=A0A255DZJ2_9MYCO|nr:hypothetical protein CG716_00330 [Mycolicibacterium sphagni]
MSSVVNSGSVTAIFSPDDDFVRIADVCTALGVPQDDWVLFWRWADELPGREAADEFTSYVDVLIARRCVRPGADVVSQLITLDLTVDEISWRIAELVVKQGKSFSRYRPSRA